MATRHTGRAVLVAVACMTAANVAIAEDDSGVHAFLSNTFGQAGRSSVAEAPAAPTERGAGRLHAALPRPLTIRRRAYAYAPSPRRAPREMAAATPATAAKGGPVSIFEDRTLRPGDAVVMADGVRIFAGSRSWPYTKADFVRLAMVPDLDRGTVKTLTALNDLPHG